MFLTCTGVIVDADESGVADAHEGAGGVHTLCVLTAVVPPLRTLIDICTENIPSAQPRMPGDFTCCGRRALRPAAGLSLLPRGGNPVFTVQGYYRLLKP